MLCKNCGIRQATAHITKIVDGEAVRLDLCPQCALSLGLAGKLSEMIFPVPSESKTTARCSVCGCSYDDIVREGRVGCSECYSLFAENLRPTIENLVRSQTEGAQ